MATGMAATYSIVTKSQLEKIKDKVPGGAQGRGPCHRPPPLRVCACAATRRHACAAPFALQVAAYTPDHAQEERKRLKELSDTRAAEWPNTLQVHARALSLFVCAPPTHSCPSRKRGQAGAGGLHVWAWIHASMLAEAPMACCASQATCARWAAPAVVVVRALTLPQPPTPAGTTSPQGALKAGAAGG